SVSPPCGPTDPEESDRKICPSRPTTGTEALAVKAISAIGIGLAIAGILMSAMMEGTQIPAFINIPAALLVFGGTLGVTMAGTSMEQMKLVPKLYKLTFSPPEDKLRERRPLLCTTPASACHCS